MLQSGKLLFSFCYTTLNVCFYIYIFRIIKPFLWFLCGEMHQLQLSFEIEEETFQIFSCGSCNPQSHERGRALLSNILCRTQSEIEQCSEEMKKEQKYKNLKEIRLKRNKAGTHKSPKKWRVLPGSTFLSRWLNPNSSCIDTCDTW